MSSQIIYRISIVCILNDWIDQMAKNLNGFNNNKENGNDNPKEIGFGMVLRVKINVKEEKNQPNEKENDIDKHSL